MALTSPKFKFGDRVFIDQGNRKITGTVVSVFIDPHGAMVCRVKFDDANLIPPEMEVPQSYIKPLRRRAKVFGNWIDIDVKCPKCGIDWHITTHPIFGAKEMWYDCKDCNKTREQIEEDINNEPQEYWD